MGLYVVSEPVVIDGLHYATVPADPIEVDDELAGPLVEAGSLVPFTAGSFREVIEPGAFAAAQKLYDTGEKWDEATEQVAEAEKPEPRRRSRKPAEDQ